MNRPAHRVAGSITIRVRERIVGETVGNGPRLDGTGWTVSRRIGEGPSYLAIIDRDPS